MWDDDSEAEQTPEENKQSESLCANRQEKNRRFTTYAVLLCMKQNVPFWEKLLNNVAKITGVVPERFLLMSGITLLMSPGYIGPPHTSHPALAT